MEEIGLITEKEKDFQNCFKCLIVYLTHFLFVYPKNSVKDASEVP